MVEFTLPADVTSVQARQAIAGQIGQLQRRLGDLAQAVADRDRIIERLQANNGGLDEKNAQLRAYIEQLQDAGAGNVAARELAEEVGRWRDLARTITGLLATMLELTVVPSAVVMPPAVAEEVLEEAAGAVTSPPAEAVPSPAGKGEKAARVCSVPWCGRPHSSKGYCFKHYQRLQQHGDALVMGRGTGVPGKKQLFREVGPDAYEPVEDAG